VLRVVGTIRRRDVVDGADQEDDVLRAGRIVPGEHAVVDHDAERVEAGGVERRVAFPRDEVHVTLRGRDQPLQWRGVQVGDSIALRHEGVRWPVRDVGAVERLIRRSDGLGLLTTAGSVEEPAAGGVTAPRVRRGLDAANHAGNLEAGVEDVVVRGAARPVATLHGTATSRVDADFTDRVDTHVHAVDVDEADGPGEELVRALRKRIRRQCRGRSRRESDHEGSQAEPSQDISRTTQCVH
jgi:hypothetical protein